MNEMGLIVEHEMGVAQVRSTRGVQRAPNSVRVCVYSCVTPGCELGYHPGSEELQRLADARGSASERACVRAW